uniref:39S ribosomal protein L12, mitochondrial n=1 Tax=Ditylenchus dipsaci TaxID=166011 RepID=A0A915DE28_9BILA
MKNADLNIEFTSTSTSTSHCERGHKVAAVYLHPAASAESQGALLDVGHSTIPPPSEGLRNMSARVESLVDQIVSLPLLEVSDLNCALRKRLNIPDTPFMPSGMMMPMMSAAPNTDAAVEEVAPEIAAPQKISFAVKLTKFDATKKIALIKQIRDLIPGLNLVQAKKFVESAPVEKRLEEKQKSFDRKRMSDSLPVIRCKNICFSN